MSSPFQREKSAALAGGRNVPNAATLIRFAETKMEHLRQEHADFVAGLAAERDAALAAKDAEISALREAAAAASRDHIEQRCSSEAREAALTAALSVLPSGGEMDLRAMAAELAGGRAELAVLREEVGHRLLS